MTNYERAKEILCKYLKTDHLLKHSYAVEAVMRALAKKLEPQKEEEWAIAGLLHDLDLDTIDYINQPQLHGPKTVELLKQENFGNDNIYHTIRAHNSQTGTNIESKMDRAIFAADPITGFITAIALIYPDKKLSSVKLKSITKRMSELRFAAGANREAMRSIEELGIPFEEFAQISLDSMMQIDAILGL